MASLLQSVVYLGIDTSKSMDEMEGEETRLQALSKSLVELISSMKKECAPSTRIVVETFFEENVRLLFEGVLESFVFETIENKLVPSGGTPLYYVVHKGLDYLAHQPEENRIFICLTDGVNTTMAQYHPLAKRAVTEAPTNKTTVFFVGNSDAVTASACETVGVSENSLFTLEGGKIPGPLIRAITREASCQHGDVAAPEVATPDVATPDEEIPEPPKLTRETICNLGDSEEKVSVKAPENEEFLFEPPAKMMRTVNMP